MISKSIKFIKANLFLTVIIFSYLTLAILNPNLSLQGVKNSSYYIKEMLMIMPVIFVLTALLDSWIPKEAIIKILGKEAKSKGILLSFFLGSISAGPIYAAFPLCGMLYNKGASIKNIVIILSSWAVVKIPMLLNEAKFLGLKFMITRWILTIIAILIFSYITSIIVKDKDFPKYETIVKSGVYINKDVCMGCSVCTKKYSDLFEMNGKKANVKEYTNLDIELLKNSIKACPVKAIEYN